MAFLGVVLSRHKFTPRCPVGETKEEKERYKKLMRKDINKRYELIAYLSSLGLLEERWSDNNYVEFSTIINGVNYELYLKWLKEQEEKADGFNS